MDGRREKDVTKICLKEGVRRCGLDSSGSGSGPVAGCCENDNEPSGSIKGKDFAYQLTNC
jgi:hypothetical protein